MIVHRSNTFENLLHPLTFRNPYLQMPQARKKHRKQKKQKEAKHRSYVLRTWDMFCYLIGILARLQTVMIGYTLFWIEPNNICVVADKEYQPMPLELLPPDLNNTPGEFAIISYVFQSILLTLFLLSCITTGIYLIKIWTVLKWHRADPSVYRKEALPAVRRYKIWNSILGLSLTSCLSVFLTHAGRVCAGWYLPS